MIKWKIPRRTASEAQIVKSVEEYMEDDAKLLIEDLKELEPLKYEFKARRNLWVPLPIEAFNSSAGDARLTLVLSDTHLGDTDHLPETFWSTVNNLKLILQVLKKRFDIPHIDVIINGDLVCGKGVFRYQEFRTLVPRGHWQTAVAEIVLKDMLKKIEEDIKVQNLYILKGTHEEHGENYAMYIKRSIANSKYGGRQMIYNLAQDLGKYNMMLTHGYGSSDYYPISYTLIRDLWKFISQYKVESVPIERVCIGHYHWLNTGQNFESFTLDCTGGFQRWEKTVSQRPCGMLLYIYFRDEVSVVPIRPNPEIVDKEMNDPALEYKNMRYYSMQLLKHLEEVEGVNV